MLTLTRKRGESIVIGDNIEVVILNIQSDQIKLGIIAPRTIPVHRKEIFEQIQLENLAAMQSISLSDITKSQLKNSIQQSHLLERTNVQEENG